MDVDAGTRSKPSSESVEQIYSAQRDVRDKLSEQAEEKLLRDARLFDEAFNRVDKDANGKLSPLELNAAIEDPALDKRTAHFLMGVRNTFDRLAVLHPDTPDDAISRADMARFLNIKRSYLSARESGGVTEELFKSVDKDGDGLWSATETKAAKTNLELSTGARFLLSEVSGRHSRISGTYSRQDPPITFEQARKYYQDEDSLAVAFESGLVFDFASFAAPASDSKGIQLPLFAKGLDSIRPEFCLQPDMAGGNCQFVASLQSLARVNKQAIVDMIRDNGNDTYTVTFPARPHTPITVLRPSNHELTIFMSHRNTDSIWPYVLQKAYGRLSSPDDVRDFKGASEGAPRLASLRVLTPSNVASEISLPASSLRSLSTRIKSALDSGRPVTLATSADEGKSSFTRRHAYALLAVEPNTAEPGDSKVTIQSTYGVLDEAKGYTNLGDGKFELKLSQVNCEFVRFGLTEPVRPRSTIYNWTDALGQREPWLEAQGLTFGSAATFAVAGVFRRTGAVGLGAWSGYELANDGITAYKAEDQAVRNKYLLGTAADTMMLGGFASRLIPKTKGYGLAVAGAGFLSRWAIEKLL